MPLRGRSVQGSWRAGTCATLPLRSVQEGIWERVYGLRALAARRLRAERGHLELRRTGLLPPLRLTPNGHFESRRPPRRDSARDARRRTVRSEARGGDLGEAPRVLDRPCRGASAVRREPPPGTLTLSSAGTRRGGRRSAAVTARLSRRSSASRPPPRALRPRAARRFPRG